MKDELKALKTDIKLLEKQVSDFRKREISLIRKYQVLESESALSKRQVLALIAVHEMRTEGDDLDGAFSMIMNDNADFIEMMLDKDCPDGSIFINEKGI